MPVKISVMNNNNNNRRSDIAFFNSFLKCYYFLVLLLCYSCSYTTSVDALLSLKKTTAIAIATKTKLLATKSPLPSLNAPSPLLSLEDGDQIQIRLATPMDVPGLQQCNRASLPENYCDDFFLTHIKYWPELVLVLEHVRNDNIDSSSSSSNRRKIKSININNKSFSINRTNKINDNSNVIIGYMMGKTEETLMKGNGSGVYGYDAIDGKQSSIPENFTNEQKIDLDRYRKTGNPRFLPRETIGHIGSLAVLDSYRRRGLASALIQQFHDQLRNHYHRAENVNACGLNVRPSNVNAILLYEKQGYRTHEILKDYYLNEIDKKNGDREDGHFMRKQFEFENETKMGHLLPRRLLQPEDSTLLQVQEI